MSERVQEDGCKFLFVLAPRYNHWSTTECPKNWENVEYGNDEPYEYVYLDYFDEHFPKNIPMMNLLPAFKEFKGPPLVFTDDPHWNETGTIFVARLIGNMLLKEGMVSVSDHR